VNKCTALDWGMIVWYNITKENIPRLQIKGTTGKLWKWNQESIFEMHASMETLQVKYLFQSILNNTSNTKSARFKHEYCKPQFYIIYYCSDELAF
jgi:hypothetical protein